MTVKKQPRLVLARKIIAVVLTLLFLGGPGYVTWHIWTVPQTIAGPADTWFDYPIYAVVTVDGEAAVDELVYRPKSNTEPIGFVPLGTELPLYSIPIVEG